MKLPDKTMMHGSDYAGQDPRGWIVTEKLDGFFARWTGTRLLTREGVDFNAPEWFTAGLPSFPLDCELFAGYGHRAVLNGATRWRDKKRWAPLTLMVFDAPAEAGGYEDRHNAIVNNFNRWSTWARVARRWTCSGKAGLVQSLSGIIEVRGEGLVIREPAAFYTVGRVVTMLKVKPEFIR